MTRNGKNMGRSCKKKERQRQSLLRKKQTQKNSEKKRFFMARKIFRLWLSWEAQKQTEWLSTKLTWESSLFGWSELFFSEFFFSLCCSQEKIPKIEKEELLSKDCTKFSFLLPSQKKREIENLFLIFSLIPFHSLQWTNYFASQRLFPVFYSKKTYLVSLSCSLEPKRSEECCFSLSPGKNGRFCAWCLTCRTQVSLESLTKVVKLFRWCQQKMFFGKLNFTGGERSKKRSSVAIFCRFLLAQSLSNKSGVSFFSFSWLHKNPTRIGKGFIGKKEKLWNEKCGGWK